MEQKKLNIGENRDSIIYFALVLNDWSWAGWCWLEAIIGGGISGAASAYFLNELFEDAVQLTVFERSSRIGGRLATIEHDGRFYELGGSVIHSSNRYMKAFLDIWQDLIIKGPKKT